LPTLDTVFWGKIWKAGQRVAGAIILLGAHLLLDFLLCLAFREHEWLQKMASAILLTAFLIVYFALAIDIVLIFIPQRKPKRKGRRQVVKHNEG
jgi:cbb3-type cytochrome oxidase subunit 3